MSTMTLKYDFHNWSLQKCKELVIDYQIKREAETFHYLLARFDRYILYVIYEMKRTTPYLWSEEMQELYHTGILGFHKGIVAFKHHLEPFFLILVIKAYIKAELKQTYSYKTREYGVEHLPVIFEEEEITRELDIGALFEILNDTLDFSDKDREIVNMRYKLDRPIEEIAQKFGVPNVSIYKQIERIIKKLKKTLSSELKFLE